MFPETMNRVVLTRAWVLTILVSLLATFTTLAESGTADDPYLLWVGESMLVETGLNASSISDITWTTSSQDISYSGNGVVCTVKINKYFSGVQSVKCDWTFSFGAPGTRTFYFACKENPVMISPTTMSLSIGGTGLVSYSHQYNNQYATAANAGITYSSSNTSVATVNSSGKVTAKGSGTARIYVHSLLANDENAPYCTVTVAGPTIELPESMTLNIGESQVITPIQGPGSGYTLSWKSSNTSVATVSSSGKVTAKAKGTARITATVNGYSSSSDYCDVTVTANPTSIYFTTTVVSMLVGQTTTILPVVLPAGAEYTLSWISGNSANVSVSPEGKVTAKQVGSSVITARIKNTSLSASYTIMVVQGLRGDVNGDGVVNISDVTALITLLLNGTAANNPLCDVNGDGQMTVSDITTLLTMLLNGERKVGDVNNDGLVNVVDVTVLIEYLLKGQGQINLSNADINDDGQITIVDVTMLINMVLNGQDYVMSAINDEYESLVAGRGSERELLETIACKLNLLSRGEQSSVRQ